MGRQFTIGVQSEQVEVKPTRTYSVGMSRNYNVGSEDVKVTRKYAYKIDTSTTPPKKIRVEVE